MVLIAEHNTSARSLGWRQLTNMPPARRAAARRALGVIATREGNRPGCLGACLCPQRELAELRALLAAQEDAAATHAAETSGAAEASALKAAQERHVALTLENCEP